MGLINKSVALAGIALSFGYLSTLTAQAANPTALPPSLPPVSINDYSEVTTGSSPDNSFELFTSLIDSSRKSIRLEAYMLRSPGIAESLEKAARRGVSVSLLLDGWTVARPKAQKVDPFELYLASRIVSAGGKVLYLRSETGRRDDRRFRYLHAKYAVVDDTLFLSSENFANNGFSPTGTLGSRGWVISIKNPQLAKAYTRIFEEDIQPAKGFHDLAAYGSCPDYTLPKGAEIPSHEGDEGTYRPNAGTTVRGIISLERVMSPDDASAPKRAILGAIQEARETLEIQNLSFAPHWGTQDDSPKTDPSPLAEEVLAAARRGVKVRIMLNPLYFLPSDPHDGKDDGDDEGEDAGARKLWQSIAANWEDTALLRLPESAPSIEASTNTKDNGALLDYVRGIAKRERLDLEASFFYVSADSLRILHNKGMIVDGHKTLISSINWTENSVKNNREAAVIVDNPHVARYYQNLFEQDWQYHRSNK